jgi:ABC-type transport system involved in multi-copper enzyme maturation permease subunit
MRTIWHSLLWKEWHEHKWKLASIVAILWAIVAYAILAPGLEVHLTQLALDLVVFCLMPLSVFVALGDAAGERSRNTLPFLQALPVSTRRVAAAKLVLGLTTLIAAIVLACLFVYVWSSVRSGYIDSIMRTAPENRRAITGNPIGDSMLTAACMAVSLYLWSAAAGVNRKDEVSAGAIALLTIVGMWALLFVLGRAISSEIVVNVAHPLTVIAVASAPGSGFTLFDNARQFAGVKWLFFGAALTTHAALAVLFVRRFGQVANREIVSPRGERIDVYAPATIGAPRRSPLTAVVWKQTRESGPIALAGLAVVVAVVVVAAIGNLSWYIERPGQIPEMFAGVCTSMGVVIAMVVGIGAFLHDTGPQLNTFWRSRPIKTNLWFWSKFLTGLVILLAAIYVPTVLALISAGMNAQEALREPQMLIFPAAHMAVFAAAAAMTCLVRHAVYAAILSIPAAFLGVLAISAGFTAATRMGWLGPGFFRDVPGGYIFAAYLAGFLLSFVINILLAWLAVRYDWGRKSRY